MEKVVEASKTKKCSVIYLDCSKAETLHKFEKSKARFSGGSFLWIRFKRHNAYY